MAARTVEQYIRAGVAGAHLEDQVRNRIPSARIEWHHK